MGVERARPTVGADENALAATVAATLIAGAVLGAYLQATGLIESVAGLYGLSGAVNGWLVHLGHSFVAGAGFVLLATIAPPAGLASTFGLDTGPGIVLTSVVLGVAYAVAAWLVAVAFGIPIWMEVAHGASRPFPYLHWASLAGAVAFGATFAGSFAVWLEYAAVEHPAEA